MLWLLNPTVRSIHCYCVDIITKIFLGPHNFLGFQCLDFLHKKTAPISAPHQRHIKLGLSFVLGRIALQMVKGDQEELNLPILDMKVSLRYRCEL